MTKDDLELLMRDVPPGQGVRVPYDVFDLIFPRGHADDKARVDAYDFAKGMGFKIDNRPDDDSVWFQRNA